MESGTCFPEALRQKLRLMLEGDQEESPCTQPEQAPYVLHLSPRQTRPRTLPFAPVCSPGLPAHSTARTEVTQTGPCNLGPCSPSHRIPFQAAAAFLWVEHGREDGEGGTGRHDGATPAKSGVNRTQTPGHGKLMLKPQEPRVLCSLFQPQPY